MPRFLSNALLAEKNVLASDHPWVFLLQLTIGGAPVPFQVADYDQDVLFHGLLFSRFRMTIEALEDPSSLALVHLRITAANVDRQIQSLLENYWAPVGNPLWSVMLWFVDVTQPDETPFNAGDLFSVEAVTTDLVTANFDLIAEGLTLAATVPKRRYVASSGFEHIPRRV